MSSGNTHLSYACRQAVRPYGQDMICPYCDGGFVQELNEIDGGVLSPFDFFGLETNEHHDHRLGIMDVLSALMRQRMRLRNGDIDVRGRRGMIAEHAMRFGPGPWLIFHGQLPVCVFENGGIEVLLNGAPAIGLRRANMGDYHFGADLDELIEQLTRNDRHGPPPASQSAIDAMPAVKIINQRHLRGDSHCPHNSCPVCRHELPPQGSGGDVHRRSSSQALVLEIVRITDLPQAGRMVEKVKAGETHYTFCDLSATRTRVLVLTGMNQQEAVLLLFMKMLTR